MARLLRAGSHIALIANFRFAEKIELKRDTSLLDYRISAFRRAHADSMNHVATLWSVD